ncbi:hypothetical protein FO519_007505 [Halicephalobus sp. NKZ332]|nr:hypothetical protein FO519_007505 [Halicephalobus sp. NKZ332]
MGQSGSSTSSGPALTQSGHVYMNRYPWCKYFSYIRTVFGIVTVFIAFSAGLDALFSISGVPMGIYLITIAIPMFLLEFGRIVRVCCGNNGPLCNVFGLVLSFDRWKRGLLYCSMAVVCFFPSIATVYGRVAGCFIFVCGVLYVAKCFQKKKISTYIVDPSAEAPSPAREVQGY